MRVPPLGEAVPRRGNVLTRALGRAVLAALGWRIEGSIPDVPRLVAIVAPHTSNWDFVFGLGAILALGLDVRWLGKHTLFRPPFGPLLRRLGGIPVDRDDPGDLVLRAVSLFREPAALFLGIAPEGTRRKVEKWKSGFHRIALGARVPILPAALDYRDKTVRIFPVFVPTPDLEADLALIRSRYSSAMARYPESY